MSNLLCPMPFALCLMHYAQCRLPYARCLMPNAVCLVPPPVEYSGDGRDGQHTDARICEGGVGSAVGGSDRPGTRHVEDGAAHELRHHRKEPGISRNAVRAPPVVALPIAPIAVASPLQ